MNKEENINYIITMAGETLLNSNFYYGEEFTNKNFYNSLIANKIALETHFGELLFRDDLTRIIYSPNDFCFRDRLRKNKNESGDLNIPFMNYYLKPSGVNKDTSPRALWNNMNQIQGMLGDYQEETGFKFKVIPINLNYEGTVFYSQPFDVFYAQQQLNMKQANENILYSYFDLPNVTVSGYDSTRLEVPIFINYEPDYNAIYDQTDWLEENKILTIGMDIEAITFFIFSDDTEVSLSKEVILNFISTKDIDLEGKDPTELSSQELIQIILEST